MLEIRTTQEMRDISLAQLRISYLDNLIWTRSRQASLQGQYYFRCACQHCEGGEQYNMVYKHNYSEGEDLSVRIRDYISESSNSIQSGKDIMEEMKERICIESIIFLQVSKLLFTQCVEGDDNDTLEYGEICRAAFRHHTHLSPMGNIITLVRLARARFIFGLGFRDIMNEILEIENNYFKAESIDVAHILQLIQ